MTTATRAKPARPAWKNRIVRSAQVAPAELTANPRNWRTHPKRQVDALEGALREVGWVQQVIVNERTGRLVDGHARVERALERNEPSVPVLYVDLTEAEEALVLATLDPLGAMAETDESALEALLTDVATDDDALRAMLGDLGKMSPGETEPDDAPDVAPAPWVKAGELYELGDHRLLCGDSTNAADVARLMGDVRAECIWTDPPYGVSYVGKTRRRLTLANDGEGDVVGRALAAAGPVLAPSARFYIACPAGPRQALFFAAVEAVGWRLHQELVWVKGSIVLGHSDYHYAHEPVLYGYTPGDGRPGRGAHAGTRWFGDHSQSSVLEYPKPSRSVAHPTMKPVGLVEQCLRNSTAAGDVVYEPFAGSGTTVIAAEQLGRRCYALELDPAYVQVAVERWQAFTGREAVRVAA